jgi:NACalpha-BTF3-like transcription factor
MVRAEVKRDEAKAALDAAELELLKTIDRLL